jgi:T5SS/PEP-CTERM-associated repeat protein
MLAMSLSIPAQAQFFISTGANSSFPVNLFPIDPSLSVLDFTGNTVSIGNSQPGSFSALAGALLKADGLNIGDNGTGSGSVSVTGAGTRVQLGGAANRLQVGNWGVGSLMVSDGAVIDAALNTGVCPTGTCNSFIGNGAGSTATLTITGAGSEVSAVRSFVVGQAAVFTQAINGFDFGTPGGTTNAFVNVLAGGTLRTQRVTVGQGPTTAAATGTEKGFGTVIVDGVGSRWLAGRNTVDNTAASFVAGNGAGGHASITVRNGGQLAVDGSGGSASVFDALILGTNGGQGELTVTGAGSSVSVAGANPFLGVGRSGAGSQGTFSVLAGATASAMFMSVGRDGAAGTLLVDGAGSQLSLAGVGTTGVAGAAFANIGRGGGTGAATVSNGGRLVVSDGGADSRPGNGSPGIAVGQDAGSSGLLTISGAGSRVEVVSTSLGVPAGIGDNFNPFVGIGFDSPGSASGQLMISDGGKLVLTGNAFSDATFSRVTSVQIGGRGLASGTGSATVTGAGSEILLSGSDTFIGVGRGTGSTGVLNVLNQARVTSTSFLAGENSVGTVNVDNAQILLHGFRNDLQIGAGMTIGRGAGGNGVLSFDHGANLTIENNTLSGGMSIGGDQFGGGGTGTVSLANASSITFTGSSIGGSLSIGRFGNGTMSLDGASIVDVGDTRSIFVGRSAGGVGGLSVVGGSKVISGDSIGIGGDSDSVAGGIGVATLSGLGSELRATSNAGFVSVGRSGAGSLSVTDQATLSAKIVNVGRAAGGFGALSVDNAIVTLAGQQPGGLGAALSIGNRGGTGSASIANGSQVTITNLGSGGASLNVGGTPVNPLGSGTLDVTNSQIKIVAAPGQGVARIGHDGTGTANFSASTLDVAGGSVIIAGVPGSTGTLSLSAGSVVNTGHVGIGASSSGPGGNGRLILNNSTINTTTFEIGALGVLSGDGGVINATGDVLVAGTIDPGNSPGRININCNFITLPGSRIVLDILGVAGGFDVDHLILGNDSTFDLSKIQIVFNFLGSTDPTAFAASGGFSLDNFLQSMDLTTGAVTGLSTVFGPDQTWTGVIDSSLVSATSSAFDITGLKLQGDGGFEVTAAAVPEPATWATLLVGLLALALTAGRRASRRSPPFTR